MIKIAIISDIHANIIAFKEVLKDIDRRNISQIYCLGDLVDFAPWGNQVISLIKEKGIPCLLGNHDERIAFDLPIVGLPHHNQTETRNRAIAINLSKNDITFDNKKWLSSLPYNMELTFKIKNSIRKILLVHASMLSNDRYIYESDPKTEMLQHLQERSIDALFMGHTHLPFIQEIGNTMFVNCGSVGRSKEAEKKAVYSILTLGEESIEAEIIRLPYDVNGVARAIYASSIPDFYADFLINR